MNGTMFQFGAGSRTCIGKNISLMEIYKLVPSFLRRFDVSSTLVAATSRVAPLVGEIGIDESWFTGQIGKSGWRMETAQRMVCSTIGFRGQVHGESMSKDE